jgi:parallel beta-helix repeat protein
LGIGEGNVVIRDNTIKNNPVGIGGSTGGTATIERNLITNNTEGISTGSLVTIRNSTITDSSVGIRLSKSSPATINYNNIQNNIQNSIYLEGTSNNTDATYNWWGTTDTQSINMTIHDSKYDFNLGKVTFLPFSTESNPNALPRSNLTLPPMPSPTPTDTPAPAQSPAPTFSPAPTQSSTPSPSQNPSPLPSQSPISMPDQSSSQDASQMWLYGIVAVLAAMNVALIVVVVVLVIRKKR